MDPITTREETTTTTRETVTPAPSAPTRPPTAPNVPARRAAATGLVVVGFIALIVLGIWLAIAAARLVPNAVTYLGDVFGSDSATTTLPSSLAIVPTDATTTIPFDNPSGGSASPSVATSTTTSIASSTTTTTTKTVKTVAKAPVTYKTIITTYPVAGSTRVVASATNYYYGLPDLTVKINAVGYLTANTPGSFVVSSTVPVGMQPAVEFTITNIGTNVAPASRFFSFIPTTSTKKYESTVQPAINPGNSIQYTMGFTQAARGTNQIISVTANFDGAIAEIKTTNNTATSKITIL